MAICMAMAICTMVLIASRRFPMEAAFLVLAPKVPALLASTATFVSVAVLISMAVLALSVVVAVSEKPAKGRREVVRLVAMIEAVIVLVYFTTTRTISVVVLLTMSVAVLISVTVIKAAATLALLALMVAVSKQVAQDW
jgi:hypothetical protein